MTGRHVHGFAWTCEHLSTLGKSFCRRFVLFVVEGFVFSSWPVVFCFHPHFIPRFPMPTDLSTTLGRLTLRNPILVASGTFGYAREAEGCVDFAELGGVIPKTVTRHPRVGNPPPRTVETPSGLLNAIGLDNDGIEHFIAHHLPYLRTLSTAIVVNIAGKNEEEFIEMAAMVGKEPGPSALELNLSCPNVAGGADFAADPAVTRRIVRGCRDACSYPVIAKLSPNVTDVTAIARAAADGGADAVSLVNTFVGIAIDWRRKQAVLGNGTGGLSGPAIKPLALRVVWQVARAKILPVIGVGGIATLDDVMEFLVAGAMRSKLGPRISTIPRSALVCCE